jgi:PIN domain nuclease of toxin-antitoxin system
MGRSFANLAPNNESHPIHPTQELPGSALRFPGFRLVGTSRRIAFEAADVPQVYGSGDPGDCFLIATARIRRMPIVTRDAAMIGLSEVNPAYLQTVPC